MRPSRLRSRGIAVWLGVIALALNALVPIHLAFDLADSLAPRHDGEDAAAHDAFRHMLALLVGHDSDNDHAPSNTGHHHDHCAVCGAIATLAGFAPAAVVLLAVPTSVYAATLSLATPAAPRAAPLIAYHARAPPVA